jgi:adenine-specific DNA-methyltransferase
LEQSIVFNHKDVEAIKNKGVVFTPKKIADKIVKLTNPNVYQKICEPSVGKGVFVFSLLDHFFKEYNIKQIAEFIENNLYCYDINQDFINEFKELLRKYLLDKGYEGELNLYNIKCQDFLTVEEKFDLIIGNPPYVRIQNLDENYINSLKGDLKSLSEGNIDLYYAFIEKSIQCSGIVSLIVPNSFIKNKSAKYLRNILLDKINYIYDYGTEKVWDNISTYTCILNYGENTDTIIYETYSSKIIKNRKELSEDKWVFNIENNGNKKLSDLTNSYSGGIATIKDSVFKNTENIEKGICKKYIKATKHRQFSDYEWIIYPYDSNNKILEESYIQKNYPKAYQYLLENKELLNTRDKGKTGKYDSWYAYGRRQGLLKDIKGVGIILPLTFLRKNKIHYIEIPNDENCLVMSGILIDVKKEFYNQFLDIISSENFYDHCQYNNKVLKGKSREDIWLTINASTIKNYMY